MFLQNVFHQKHLSTLYDAKQIWGYQYRWMYKMISFITDQPVNSLLDGITNEYSIQAQSVQSAHPSLFEFF